MEKEALYFCEDAYIKIINWPLIAKIANIITKTPDNISKFWKNDFTSELIDNKNNITYSYEYKQIDLTTRKIKLSSSDGRELSICYAYQYNEPSNLIIINYKLNGKYMNFYVIFDESYNPREVEILYDNDTFHNSYLTFYKKIIKYGKQEEREKAKMIHEKTVDKLLTNVFNEDELTMFENLISKYVEDKINFEREERRIYLALVGDGISR